MKITMRRVSAAAVALATLVALPAQAQNNLTLQEAMRLSVDRQPALTAFNRTVEAAQEAAIAAGQQPDLKLRVGIRNLPVTESNAFSFDAEPMTMKYIGIGREQIRRSKRTAAASRILAEGQVSLAEQDLLARRIQREVMLGWIAVVEAREKADILRLLVRKLEGRQSVIEAEIPTGRATPADALAVQAEIMAVRARLSAVRDQEAAGRAMLSRWIGEAAERPITGEELPICRPADKQQALASLADHPLLEVARRRTTVAERAIDFARADRKLDWGWSVMYGQRGNDRSDVLSLELSIDLPLNRSRLQDRRIAEAASLAAAARDRIEDTRREITANFEQAWAEWSGASAELDATVSGTLPALQGAEEAYQARVAGGQPALGEVLAASERVTRTVLETVEQRADLARTSADLLFYLEECTT